MEHAAVLVNLPLDGGAHDFILFWPLVLAGVASDVLRLRVELLVHLLILAGILLLERLLVHVRVSRLRTASAVFILRERVDSHRNTSPRTLCNRCWLSLIIAFLSIHGILISHSIFLSFNLLLHVDVCGCFLLFHLLLSRSLLHILGRLWSWPVLSLQVWLFNYLIEVSVAVLGPLGIPIEFLLVWRSRVGHGCVRLPWFWVPYWRIFWHVLAASVRKAAAI